MALPVLFTPVLAWFGSFFAKFLTDSLLKYVAYKLLAVTLVTVTLPIVLKNLLVWLFSLLTAQISQLDLGTLSSVVVEISGLAAWFAVHLRVADCMSILITALVIRLTLNFIPFVG